METNKSYRIKARPGEDGNLVVQLNQDYDTFEILSLTLNTEGAYRLHDADYGVIVGRVQSGNFGIPNAKISVFIESDGMGDEVVRQLYPYATTTDKGVDGVRYNLLPDEKVDNCHQVVGTFPNKRYLLDNDALLEVFDSYYKYTTRTNNSGDYMIVGVPTGNQTVHMDLDLSDCGILSQRPRDFVYKGYTVEQFENPNMFKTDKEIDTLSQIFSQDQVINVIPFWGDTTQGGRIGITRADISIPFKFEPTCVFMGCIVGDNASNGISRKCIPTENMGAMDELVTGTGTIEMIRKTPSGDVEEFQVKGTEVIDSNGVWCYQIPMNLDYMMTDEYGNLVPTNDPDKGIPTRTRVRFRVSMEDFEENTDNYFRAKVLVPNNPENAKPYNKESNTGGTDYNFGTETAEDSFRDLFWNGVYSVKSYIPRFQKSQNYKNQKFSGIKHCNIYGQNNPMPYNNIRIKMPLMFTILCALIKVYIKLLGLVNGFIYYTTDILTGIAVGVGWFSDGQSTLDNIQSWKYSVISDGLCPDLENWYFAPIIVFAKDNGSAVNGWVIQYKPGLFQGTRTYEINLFKQTFKALTTDASNYVSSEDKTSIDYANRSSDQETVCLTNNTDYVISCIEMNLAQEYKVINFDFYNDWINGVIYMPRWMRFVRAKRSYLFGLIKVKEKIRGCMSADSEGKAEVFGRYRKYTQQCSLTYDLSTTTTPSITTSNGCNKNDPNKFHCHKKVGMAQEDIFGSQGGVVTEKKTMQNQYVYYFKPKANRNANTGDKIVNLFATDIILLGSLNDVDRNGIPQAFKRLSSSSYKLPTNLALTNMDTNGYLYANQNGTYCSSNEQTTSSVRVLSGTSQTFENEKVYYSVTKNDRIDFGSMDDYIPLTEAAGIAWNYTGPGQGNPKKSELYQPGGHFLGMSCVNAESNIKSCINLSRICEIGTTMSERHEEVRSITNNNGSAKLQYRNYVPTGIINKIDMNDGDFRTMFATMNHKKLLANKRKDPKTGYPVYDFAYLYSSGFDGTLKDKLTGTEYNRAMSTYTVDESGYLNTDTSKADYDPDIKAQSYTRTLEEKNIDYYMFRLGVDDMKLATQRAKYLLGNKMPQYNNSFYFYFGLKDGSTALDELNKQFFSPCGETNLDGEE